MPMITVPPLLLLFLHMISGVSSADWGVSYSPSHICALKDSSVIMNCTYTYPTGYQIMRVLWTKTNDKEDTGEHPDLSEDPEYSQRLQYLGDKQQNCTIRLSHVTLNDSHEYYFRFITDKDDGKWIGVPGVTLNVTDLQVESPERVTEGRSVRLTCKSSCTLTDIATFIWYRDSQPLTERRDRNNELLLQSVRREDAGRYSCAVHGHNHTSPAVELNVMYPPKDVSVSISPSGEIVSGDSVTLNCSSDSNPPALNFSWFKGETFVKSGRIFSISNISSDHSGEYKCRSRNKHGEKDSDAVKLNVMYPPKSVSVSISPSGEIVSGDSVTLNCSSDSNPPALNFSWFKEDETSAVGSGQSFSISSFSSSFSGRFYCEAQNKYGSQRSASVSLTVKGVQRAALHTVSGIVAGCGALIFIIIIIIIIIVFIKKKRRDGGAEVIRQNQEDRSDRSAETALTNDTALYSLVSANQRDDLYANFKAKKPERSGRKQAETDSGDVGEVQYASVHHFKNKDMKKTEENDCQTIETHHPSEANRSEDVIYSSVK